MTTTVKKVHKLEAPEMRRRLHAAVGRYGSQFIKHEIRSQRDAAKRNSAEGRRAAIEVLKYQLATACTPAKRLKLMNRIAKAEAALK